MPHLQYTSAFLFKFEKTLRVDTGLARSGAQNETNRVTLYQQTLADRQAQHTTFS
jgi:hypothetical protein